MKLSRWWIAALIGLACASTHAAPASTEAAQEKPAAQPATVWKAWGGEIQFRWKRSLANDYGFSVSAPVKGLAEVTEGIERLSIRDANALSIAVLANGAFDGFRGGQLSVQGGYDLSLPDGGISLREFTLRPRQDDPLILDVVGGDGIAWFYIDRLMYKLESKPDRLSVLAMDLRISERLAKRLGDVSISGHVVAGLSMIARVHGEGFAQLVEPKAPVGCGKWHGCEVTPGGPLYEADVFMWNFSSQYMRRDADANGPGGTDGLAVFTPSSTLSNNRNNGSATVTVSGDPLGTSAALNTANVPWYTKFSGNFNPHGNDQHPFLIWNLYRIDANGRITQIGRSGVKHAWLTTNSPCDEHPGSGHILGRGCRDTYGVGNNDEITDLGPRGEIVPAKGIWGRCGSVYDKDCNGSEDANAPCAGQPSTCADWAYRMQVRESKIDPAANPGATYLFESWYIVRDDVNIFNTMQTRPVTLSWNGSAWPIVDGSPTRLGPAIDRWAGGTLPANTQQDSDLIDREEGHARVVARVTDLGGGQYRYDYAVMNFDFAEEVISGTNPNLRVESNDGFVQFRVPVPAGANVSAVQFDDGDTSAGNDWLPTIASDSVTWNTATGNELDWGTLFSFSFVSDAAPEAASLNLVTAQPGTPDVVVVDSLGPSLPAGETYAIGGSVSGLTGGQSVSISLNGGETLVVNSNTTFLFVTELGDGASYDVAVTATSPQVSCVVIDGNGTVSGADVTDVSVVCETLPDHLFGDGFETLL